MRSGFSKAEIMSFNHTIAIELGRRRWLPYRIRRSLIKRLHPTMLAGHAFETDFFDRSLGLRFRGDTASNVDRQVYFFGAYEKYMLRFFRDYVTRLAGHEPRPLVYLDIGANVGNHVLFMSRLVDTVFAFEPFDRARKQLEVNIAINHLANVTVYPFGLSDENKNSPLYAVAGGDLVTASFWQDFKQDHHPLGEMPLRRGDDVTAEAGIGRTHIIKADVEGYEKLVLAGLHGTLRRDRPLMVVEISQKTRETLAGPEDLRALFPERYRFFCFASASRAGAYRLKPFEYEVISKMLDVIACPEEAVIHLPGI